MLHKGNLTHHIPVEIADSYSTGEKQLNIIFKLKTSKLTFLTLLSGRVTGPRCGTS